MDPNRLYDLLRSLNLDQLRQRGRNYFACCPSGNHTDRRPSWGISLEAPHWHGCFACSYKGTLSTLLITAGYSPKQARIVAGEGEFDTHDFQFGKKAPQQIQAHDEDNLYPFYPTVRSDTYCRLRGLSLATIREAGIMHDVASNRVLFPWFIEDKLVALVGRALNWKQVIEGPKLLSYLPESAKRQALYLPGRRILRKCPLICVEGEMDALRIFNLRLDNFSVCGMGHSKVTKQQRDLILNSGASEIVAFGDDDKQGRALNSELQAKLASHCRVRIASYGAVRQNYQHLRKLELDPAVLDDEDLRLVLKDSKGKYFPRWQ